jgi:hypothetical protein
VGRDPILEVDTGELVQRDAPALNALNERLRDDFVEDSIAGVEGWNVGLKKRGIDFRFTVPHKGCQPTDRAAGRFEDFPGGSFDSAEREHLTGRLRAKT